MSTQEHPPLPRRVPARGRSVSFVWLAPIVALLITAWVAYQALHDRGPLIEITFPNAGGIEAERTVIRRNDVEVGVVEEVRLSEDADEVIVTARVAPELAPYLGQTTSFWLVGAQISGGQVSGLETLLSGSYIAVDWEQRARRSRRQFDGSLTPPLTPPGTPGIRLLLTTDDAGTLSVGAPVLYRGIEVGRVEARDLTDDGDAVRFTAFVDAPYDRFVTPAARFWNASGVDVTAGSTGFQLDVGSLTSVLIGGIAFEGTGGGIADPITDEEARFRLFDSRSEAEESLFAGEDDAGIRFIARFDQSLAGLRTGAPVTYQGVRIGTVADVFLDVASELEGRGQTYAILQFQPERMGLSGLSQDALRERFERFAQQGVRAQLSTGNLLTGALTVRLADVPDAAAQQIDFGASPYPSYPTVPSSTEELAANLQAIIDKAADLPVEDLLASATAVFEDLDRLLSDPAVAQAPAELTAALASLAEAAERIEAASAGVAPNSELQVELIDALREFRETARRIGAVAQTLEERPNALLLGRD